MVISVLVVHDTRLMRSALAELLGKEPDLDVTAASWRSALPRLRGSGPDVWVVDVDCPGADTGLAGLGDPTGGALLALGTAGRPGRLRRAFEARALGYVDKDAPPDRLSSAIRQVASGRRYIDQSLGFGFLEAAQMPLTQRELSVLSLAAEGASISEIARSLHLSNGTVRNYMAAITRKTGARNRVDAIRISHGAGWV
jgi:two-component system, NarL family, response regulator DesR